MKTYFNLLAIFLCVSTHAASVKFGEPSDQKIADIALSSKATVDLGKPQDLVRVASGIREKTFLKIKVYVMQVFANAQINKTNGDAAIESLWKNRPAAMALTFVRNVEGKQIVDAYKESLKANNINGEAEPFKNFLEEVQKRAESKKNVTLWFVLGDQEQITFYTEGKESVTFKGAAGSNFQKNFLSIWFGKTTDGGLENLKEQLLK